jgi:hypothetical protein
MATDAVLCFMHAEVAGDGYIEEYVFRRIREGKGPSTNSQAPEKLQNPNFNPEPSVRRRLRFGI